MRTLIGCLGIMFIPLAIICVAFKSSCSFVVRWANEGLENIDD
jgi:hypothetical protein